MGRTDILLPAVINFYSEVILEILIHLDLDVSIPKWANFLLEYQTEHMTPNQKSNKNPTSAIIKEQHKVLKSLPLAAT